MAGLKINMERLKGVKNNKFSNTVKVSVVLGLVVFTIIGLNFYSTLTLRDTVEIVKLTSSVPQDGSVFPSNMYKDTMLKSEYEKQGVYTLSNGLKRRSIVLWDDRTRIKNAYAAYYIRKDTPLYWDSLTKETPKKYSYLYKMDGELLKLDLKANEFGKMLVPGDRINVRASYTENEYKLPDEKDILLQQQMGIQPDSTVTRNIKLFNNVPVLDILNKDGDSIFDIYYKLLALPKQEQQTTVASEDFQKKIQSTFILLNLTTE
jgi:hypothetical protein